MANFRTKARAIDLLGKNQIADLPTAITELWKNGYDAYGDYLDAKLYISGYKGIKTPIFTISDDGHGMTAEDILNKWIVIGTDSKRNSAQIIPIEDRFGKPIRVPLGEKGIGRLSVSYLGNHMLMITKKKDCQAQMLFMNWHVLENYEMFLEDVEIPTREIDDLSQINETYHELQIEYMKNFDSNSWDDFSELKRDIVDEMVRSKDIPQIIQEEIENHFKRFGHGTYFVVFDPLDEIVELSHEQEGDIKEVKAEILEQTKYVKSALSGLFNPFDKELLEQREQILKGDVSESPSFYIFYPDGNAYDFLGKDFFTEDDFITCEHWIDGIFDEKGVFTGKIKVFGDVEEYHYAQRIKPKTNIGKLVVRMAFWEGAKTNTSMPEEKWNMFNAKGEIFSGLYIYRDGFRVLPYGRTDFDFLEFEKRRSMSAGTYYFSHRKMFGFIGITKQGNPELIDKSGREGFVSNEAYRELKRLLIGFFKKIAADKYGTHAEARQSHMKEMGKEKERAKLIAEEKRKNRQKVREVWQCVETNANLLQKEYERLVDICKEADHILENASTIENKTKDVIRKLDLILETVVSLRVIVPADVSIYGYDEVADIVAAHEQKCFDIESIAKRKLMELNAVVRVKTLAERYLEKYGELLLSVDNESSISLDKIQKFAGLIVDKSRTDYEARYVQLKEMQHSIEELQKMKPEQIQRCLNEVEDLVRECRLLTKTSLEPMGNHLEELFQNDNWCAILTAYKTTEAELSHRLDLFYELAQVGMAIDVVDHQFNVLYEQIARNLNDLEKTSVENQADTINALRMAFQHMEENQKMLMPLYRKTRKRRNTITGADIEKIINQFYGEIFERNGVRFEVSDAFRKYSYFSYEAILIPVFLNVVNNAVYWVEFSKGQKIIRVDLRGEEVLILNSGPKMSHTELTRCFELFYTKKSADSGRGIGLFLARRSLSAIDMEIYATNDETYNQLAGACFVIREEED